MAYAEQMSRKQLMQDLETHFFTNHPKREVKSTDLTMTKFRVATWNVGTLKRRASEVVETLIRLKIDL